MRIALILAALALGGCGQKDGVQAQAIRAAEVYREAHGFTRDGGLKGPVTVRNNGEQWVVIYDVPKGYAGGPFMVLVDKRTMKAVNHVAWQ